MPFKTSKNRSIFDSLHFRYGSLSIKIDFDIVQLFTTWSESDLRFMRTIVGEGERSDVGAFVSIV